MRLLRKTLILLLCALLGTGCAKTTAPISSPSEGGGTKLRVVATLFPQYDFARTVGGDCVDVTMLLAPGVESHSFDPTPADLVTIGQSDLFLYTGDEMEPWAKKLAESGDAKGARIVDLSAGITLTEEAHGSEAHGGHGHAVDPHIWTSPANAMQMIDSIAAAFSEKDPQHAAYYAANAAQANAALEALDDELFALVKDARRDVLVFGGRFAFHYLTERYGLHQIAAFDSCSSETEPSAKAVAEIIDAVREQKIPVVYYEELSEPKVARMIAEETGAKLLLLHSCHNLSKEEFEAGETYLSLMRQNVANLREGLC